MASLSLTPRSDIAVRKQAVTAAFHRVHLQEQKQLRYDFLEAVYFSQRWPDDGRFIEHAGFFLSKLGGMAGAW